MSKKKIEKNNKVEPKPKKSTAVISMVDKIHHKTEKQLVGFVKELVKQKKNKKKMEQKLKKSKVGSKPKISKQKDANSKKSNASPKKPSLKLVIS